MKRKSRHESRDVVVLSTGVATSSQWDEKWKKRKLRCLARKGDDDLDVVTEGVWILWGGDEMGRMHERGDSD